MKLPDKYYRSEAAINFTNRSGVPFSYSGKVNPNEVNQINPYQGCSTNQPKMQHRIYHTGGKSIALTSFAGRLSIFPDSEGKLRILTPIECERLQTLPDNYTAIMKPLYLSEEELQRAKLKYASKVWASGNRMGNMKFPDNTDKKSKSLCATLIKGARETIHIQDQNGIRILTPVECERLQTLPDNYTAIMNPKYTGKPENCNNKYLLSEKAVDRINRKHPNYGPQIYPDKTGTLNTKNNSGQLSMDRGTTLIPCGPYLRRTTEVECERLQTVPDNYTATVSDTQRYKMLGNGWTIDVIAHIFKNLPMKPINVLSLFDGMSCGQLALQRAGIPVNQYFASEIDKPAISVTQANFPNTVQLGSVVDVDSLLLPKIDLLIGGSPCQGFSFAGRQLNFKDSRSVLFFEFVRLKEQLEVGNPDFKFFLENVKMKKEYQDIITKFLGVEPIEINSALVSAQNRKRLYWTNIPGVTQPEDRGILLKDIVLSDALPVTYTERRTEEAKKIRRDHMKLHGTDFCPRREKELVPRQDDKSNCLTATFSNKEHLLLSKKALSYMDKIVSGGRSHWDFKHHSDVRNDKSAAVVANFFKGVPYNVLKDFDCVRAFDPIECERLQTVPEGYTAAASTSQRFRMLGNGWTVNVISHIFKNIA